MKSFYLMILVLLAFGCGQQSHQFGLGSSTSPFNVAVEDNGSLDVDIVDTEMEGDHVDVDVVDESELNPSSDGENNENDESEQDSSSDGEHDGTDTQDDPADDPDSDDQRGPDVSDIPGLSPEPSKKDKDGDSIPDGEDNFPGNCIKIAVTGYGVSSARVSLNGDEIVGPNNFHNKEESTIAVPANLSEGKNQLNVRIAGSPGDRIVIQVIDCSVEPPALLAELSVTRTTGKPNEDSENF